MVKINFEVSKMTFAEALNAALDVASHCRKVPVAFVFQGVEFVVTCQHENVMPPQIIEPRRISDFDDETLCNEYFRRTRTSQDFRDTVEQIILIAVENIRNG